MEFTNLYGLLKELCQTPSTSGDEQKMSSFILDFVLTNKNEWASQPAIFTGASFQDSIVLAFGKPAVAIFAHLDSVGFAAAYGKRLVKIGGAKANDGSLLVGRDSFGDIECTLRKVKRNEKDKDGKPKELFEYEFHREIERGTTLTYKPVWRETDEFVQCCYMDNRLGVLNALNLCSNLKNAAIVFTTYEEQGGGTAQFIGRFLYKSFGCHKALISDVTLTSEGIEKGKGVVISMRDRGIPRQCFMRQLIEWAKQEQIDFQLEVEDAGGSDGTQLQLSSYPWDWCFIGPPEDHYHTPDEMVFKHDIESMFEIYKVLTLRITE